MVILSKPLMLPPPYLPPILPPPSHALSLIAQNLFTPLHHACNRGHLFIAKLLIDHKCDVDAQNKVGRVPGCWGWGVG